MAIGTHEKTVRMRAARSAATWRGMQYEERDGFGYDTVRARPLPSQLLFGLLFARMLDHEPVVGQVLGVAPSVVSVRVPSEQVADVLLRVAPHVGQGGFPRPDKKRGAGQSARTVYALKEYEHGYGGMRKEEARERLSGGASLLCFWFENEANIPSELSAVLSDSVKLPKIDAQALRWLGGIVTGEAVNVPGGHPIEALTPAQIDVAFGYGLDAAECKRRLAAFTPVPTCEAPQQPSEAQATTLRELRAFGSATDWGLQLADDLAAFKAGLLPWSEIDRGALLHGVPGVGKTTFAKALAATCEVPLIATSVADWYARDHLGATLKRIRSVFADPSCSGICAPIAV
ncbi:AAA family ATPase, partial [Azorhizobium caulinodans]|uniref:AAA family ATPase n=1 Tax=Azorhizobium caulinodans TaxID=7 RepID=UPI002FBE8299